MTTNVWISRRRFAAFIACALAAPALAQDPRVTSAQLAAREWLAYTDALDGAASHARAGAKFKKTMSLPVWTTALRRERGPRGKVRQRTMVNTNFKSNIAGQPDADYAVVVFRTQFDKDLGSETLTLERESDGVWRVVGYTIR
jgi:hypothetical protein